MSVCERNNTSVHVYADVDVYVCMHQYGIYSMRGFVRVHVCVCCMRMCVYVYTYGLTYTLIHVMYRCLPKKVNPSTPFTRVMLQRSRYMCVCVFIPMYICVYIFVYICIFMYMYL